MAESDPSSGEQSDELPWAIQDELVPAEHTQRLLNIALGLSSTQHLNTTMSWALSEIEDAINNTDDIITHLQEIQDTLRRPTSQIENAIQDANSNITELRQTHEIIIEQIERLQVAISQVRGAIEQQAGRLSRAVTAAGTRYLQTTRLAVYEVFWSSVAPVIERVGMADVQDPT
ncbi:Uu.00g105120.m01.CDS01 [Anthostomella pinea]|uniref:Uu.00g105120.m01.CDS01 n=1 Tax=Anthostomella pinea TaxID=933095 RepID=A0AAI8YFN7_9PEZI|nr:Uu.00g105120.m01.CDS01 [Anthostomella pinea]